ncbi:hypothetical protein CsSME_00003787 [Camellia sinensis var. sinensis]
MGTELGVTLLLSLQLSEGERAIIGGASHVFEPYFFSERESWVSLVRQGLRLEGVGREGGGLEEISRFVLKNSSGQRRQGCRPAARRKERSIGLNLIALIPC